jgi:tRNA(His) 5'-end guanylyltransferase
MEEIKKENIPLCKEIENLGNKYKKYESEYLLLLDKTKYSILRVDGNAFHTYTKKFNKPFDEKIANAMIYATKEWIKKFNGIIGYTQSDEATIVLPRYDKESLSELPFSGKVNKLITLSSSYFTLMFNKFMKTTDSSPIFDCRIFQVETKEDVLECLRWRHLDSYRNGITCLARSIVGHKVLEKLGTKQRQEIIKNKDDFVIYKNHHVLHGTFILKQLNANKKRYIDFVFGEDFLIPTITIDKIGI